MDAWWRSTGRALARHSWVVAAVVAVVTAVAVLGLAQLDFATGQDSYVEPSSQAAVDNRRYQDLFGGENMVVLFTMDEGADVADLFNPDNVARLEAVEADLADDPAVQSVVSPLTLLRWTQELVTSGTAVEVLGRTLEREPDPAAAELRQQDLAITSLRLAAAGEQTFDNPAWVDFLVYGNDGYTIDDAGQLVAPPDDERVVRRALRAFVPDAQHAVFAAVLAGNAALEDLSDGSSAVQAAFDGQDFDGASVTITGTPTFLTDINDYLQGGMLTLGAIAVGVMVVVLAVAFGVRWRLLPLLGMLLGVVWGFGAFGFTGTDLSLVTISGLPILIGLGIEFAIQVQNRIEEERTIDGIADPYGETLARMGPPLVAATVAAVIAFLTVRISRVPMVQDFGVLLAIGIVALLVAGVVVPTAVIGERERRSPTTKAPGQGWVEWVVLRLGGLPRAAVIPLVVLAVGLPIVGLAVEGRSEVESDPINWADQGSASIRNARLLEEEVGFATTLGVFVETEGQASDAVPGGGAPADRVFTDQMGAFVFDLVTRSLDEDAELAEASSLATTVGWLAEVPGATPLPPTGLDMLQAYDVAPAALRELLVGPDGNSTQVLFQVGPSSLEDRAQLLDRVESRIARPVDDDARVPAGASATTGGLAVVGVGLLENISANRAELTIVALLLVAAFLVVRHRDLARGLLTMVPVLLAVGTSAVIVWLLDITLSPLTTIGGPLVVATCAEFSVLLVARYAEEREVGHGPEAAVRAAAERTGRAFFTSALTTLGGFAVLMASSLPLLADFGMVVTINIAVALLSALIVVPPLVEEADRRGLLALGPVGERPAHSRARAGAGWAGAAVLAIVGVTIAWSAVSTDEELRAEPLVTEAAEAPATTPPPTTAPPTTTPTSGPAGTDSTLPPGPPERPDGLVGGAFFDGLVGAGVDPGVARCAADDLLATTPEPDLLAMGVANTPRPPEVDALLSAAALRCGVTPEQLAAAGS